jgi:hypothetical protein
MKAILACNVGYPPGVLHMSAQTPFATLTRPLIATDLANAASPVRKELIEIAALDLHRAATSHKPHPNGSRTRRFTSASLPWYIPQLAVLQTLR